MRTTMAVRAGVALVAATLGALGFATPVSAHVTVSSTSAVQGGYAKIVFRVPNEKAAAGTVKLEVTLPADAPVASVSLKPTPGWTASPEKAKLDKPIDNHGTEITEAVSKITWTAAAGTAINPGEFQEFEVSMGPLPEVDQMVFKALQTYSDADVVRWIEEPAAGAEPEHPAPVLKLAAATGDGHGDAGATEAASTGDHDDGAGTPLALGIAALVLGLAGLVAGLLAYRRAGTRTS